MHRWPSCAGKLRLKVVIFNLAYIEIASHSLLDMISLMSYDFHELNRTSINAPLIRENNQNPNTETIAENLQRILEQGCDPAKLVMGIPTYGRTYTLKNPNQNGVDAPVDSLGEPGPYTLAEGSLGFNEVSYLHRNFHFSPPTSPQH